MAGLERVPQGNVHRQHCRGGEEGARLGGRLRSRSRVHEEVQAAATALS